MVRHAAAVFLVLTFFAGGVLATEQSPFGSWEVVSTERSGVSYEVIMTIEEERVRMTTRCSHMNDTVEVQVSSAAQVTDRELRITESERQEREHSPGYLRCSAAIHPATLAYELRDGRLVLSDPANPKPVVLTRIAP